MDDRRKSRRKIARTAFIASVFFGAFVILCGLNDAAVAARIGEMSGFLQLYFGGLYAIVMAYFGVGSFENVAATNISVGGKR